MTKAKKCSVIDGSFVKPCGVLDMAVDHSNMSRAKGVFETSLVNLKTGKPSRSYIGVRTKVFNNGVLFNFCPFCGVDISAPFQQTTDKQEVL